MIDLPRSTYYDRSVQTAKPLNDFELVQLIDDIRDVFPS